MRLMGAASELTFETVAYLMSVSGKKSSSICAVVEFGMNGDEAQRCARGVKSGEERHRPALSARP